ncbi:hypothetical protein [Thalassomonas actiniarum]|uniref:Uncharacterized protein n=1 Tax=Thalassomonas actiniarum TaxID=485447 RepID=A0AAE9YLJ4_9GAMM|nr:hypothetical protein [Thalassomonas actiniarum]WDD97595.1 hypothetical protein SG35_020075 [Thalassomonas actiniarum]
MKIPAFTASTALISLLCFNGAALAVTPGTAQTMTPTGQFSPVVKKTRQSQLLDQRRQNSALTPQQYLRLKSLVKQLPKQQTDKKLKQSQVTDQALDYAHLLLDMNIARSEEDGQDYLIVQAKNSVYGGSRSTYIDLFLEDGNGLSLGETGAEFALSNTEQTRVQAKISLAELTRQHTGLDMIRVNSWLDIETHDGNRISQLIFSQYPIPWQQIKARMQSGAQPANPTGTLTKQMTLTVKHPGDVNQDKQIRLCLNHGGDLCDYPQIYAAPDYQTLEIPLQGQLVLPYQVASVYPSAQQPHELTGVIDSKTGIYLQNELLGYSLSPGFAAANGQIKNFSDYLTLVSDPGQDTSTIAWDIPQNEVDLINWRYLNAYQQIDWHITLVLNGYPTASAKETQIPVNFQVTLSSEHATGVNQYALPKLNTFDIAY